MLASRLGWLEIAKFGVVNLSCRQKEGDILFVGEGFTRTDLIVGRLDLDLSKVRDGLNGVFKHGSFLSRCEMVRGRNDSLVLPNLILPMKQVGMGAAFPSTVTKSRGGDVCQHCA